MNVRLKVGELAKQAGVSIRALHHYDEIGLLSPSHRTESVHRLYGRDDVVRLQQIRSLQQLGFSLEQVRACLAGGDYAPARVIEMHMARVCEQLAIVAAAPLSPGNADPGLTAGGGGLSQTFLHTMEMMSMYENYYTPEQLEEIRKRGEAVGPERIRQVEAEWPELMAKVLRRDGPRERPGQPRRAGAGPPLAGTGGRVHRRQPGHLPGAGKMWREQGDKIATRHDMNYDPTLFEYIGKAQVSLDQAGSTGT